MLIGIGCTNDLDNFVDIVKRNDQTFKDMSAFFGTCQIITCAAQNNITLVINVVHQCILQRKNFGHAIDQRQHIHAETRLQLRRLEQLIQHNLGHGILLELNDDVDAMTVGSVVDVADFGQFLVAHELAEFFKQTLTIHLIGNLFDNNGRFTVLAFDNFTLRTNRQRSTTRFVGILDALAAHNDATRGEIGTRENCHEFFSGYFRVVKNHAGGVDCFAQIVRRNIRCHTNGNTIRAVDQQVREARRKNLRLLQAFVVVRLEIDRLFIQIAQQLHGCLIQARFGVTHSCSAIAVNGAEVSVTIDQRNPHAEVLRQTHHGVVDCRVAVGVIFTHAVANRTRRFHMRLVRRIAAFVHCVQNTAMDRLQTIADIGQGA